MIIIHMAGGNGTISYIMLWSKAGTGKRSYLLLAYALCLIVTLAGCGTAGSETEANPKEQMAEAAGNSDPFADADPVAIPDTESGISDMSGLIKSLKQAVEADQTDEAKAFAQQMAGLWVAMKPDVQAADSARTQRLQEDLRQLIQAVQASKWDKELIIQLDYKLYQSFRDLKLEQQDQ
ncbi:hypothetical protein FHS16_000713 [Paenibacillus endophyticus]|uniref:DUF4363 family protein n=1 Tax=Paenibacillus endophyticus TaxID=1294268 RepID=A0A7W5C5W8_9BACL|nr:hypothetical protein [Paenibacillus endophyticus]MBB3150679.1 hypothetical protein [Paenibacillus endophyticus]